MSLNYCVFETLNVLDLIHFIWFKHFDLTMLKAFARIEKALFNKRLKLIYHVLIKCIILLEVIIKKHQSPNVSNL